MSNVPLSIDDIRNMRRHGRRQFGAEHVDLLLTALDGRDNDALSMELQRDQALRERDDRARMLGLVQDQLTERNRENEELRAACKEDSNAEYALTLARRNQSLQGDVERLTEELRQVRAQLRELENKTRPTRNYTDYPDLHPGCCAPEYYP